jgi:hypothetical protein
MLRRKIFIIFLVLLAGCTSTSLRSDISKYRLRTIGIYGSIERSKDYPREILRFINFSLEERVSQFLREEKGYRTLLWSPTSHPQSESLALTTANNQGADSLLVLKSSLISSTPSELKLETRFRLLTLPDQRTIYTGRFKAVVDPSSKKVDYASVREGLKDFPGRE